MILARSRNFVSIGLLLALAAGCYSESSIKPSETLDERTGMTVGSLEKPIELIEMAGFAALPERRVSFAYLGPVEWDNMGNFTYALWVHLAPTNDQPFDDITSPGAVRLILDDGSVPLTLLETPGLARGPYRAVASWGQSAYFQLDIPTLKRMASSGRIELDFKAAGADVRFQAAPDAREALTRYVQARQY